MGSFSGGPGTLSRALDALRDEFGPDRYNVLTRNCNSFSSALCEELLGRPIPGYVNRLAWMGEWSIMKSEKRKNALCVSIRSYSYKHVGVTFVP